jgi:hypothetical protein
MKDMGAGELEQWCIARTVVSDYRLVIALAKYRE